MITVKILLCVSVCYSILAMFIISHHITFHTVYVSCFHKFTDILICHYWQKNYLPCGKWLLPRIKQTDIINVNGFNGSSHIQ